jgi:hypothetical protein
VPSGPMCVLTWTLIMSLMSSSAYFSWVMG